MSRFDDLNLEVLWAEPEPEYCDICATNVYATGWGVWYDGEDETADDYGLLMCCDCELWATLVEMGNAWR